MNKQKTEYTYICVYVYARLGAGSRYHHMDLRHTSMAPMECLMPLRLQAPNGSTREQRTVECAGSA